MDVKQQKPKLIILTGPTAVGKTELSIRLAKEIDGEIISADSMQVYRGMDIGTAKITKEQMQGVPHHLIDCISPEEEFNVAIFQKMAQAAAKEITSRGKVPIVTGGTAFYIQALLYGIDFTQEDHDTSYRDSLYAIADTTEGKQRLHAMLADIDKEYAESVHYNNAKRVIRALEYYHYTGEKFSKYNAEQKQKTADYDFCYFVLNDDRSRLYERINERVDAMVQMGLVEEVRRLFLQGYSKELISMQGVGYKELFSYLKQQITLKEAIEQIKQNTRHFAKRQLTWFRKEADVIWVNKPEFAYDEDRIIEYMYSYTKTIGITKK